MPQFTLTITNFLFKLVTALLVLFVASLIIPFLYLSYWTMFTTAVFVSIVGIITDLTLLPKMGNVKSVGVDFIVNTLLIAIVPSIWHGVSLSMMSALGCSLVISWMEFYVHRIILRGEKFIGDTH